MQTEQTKQTVFIDTHCHFDFPPFISSIQSSLQQAAAVGIQALIVPAVMANRFTDILHLAERYPAIFAALGLHPVYIAQHTPQHLSELAQKLTQRSKKLIAVGEIGLDFYIAQPQPEKQLALLRQQLDLAKQQDLPVILHCRQAHNELLRELKRANMSRGGIMHGFSGSLQQAQHYVQLGYKIGVGGVITYPRAQKTRAAIASLPLSALVLETDAPDMPLMGFQGQPNRPEQITRIFTELCALRPQDDPEDIALTIYENSISVFGKLGMNKKSV